MSEIHWEIDYPGIKFLDIQKKIISENKTNTGVFLGTGVGKTLTCLILAEGRTLVICPKQQMVDETWQKNDKKFSIGRDLTVINYDMFWRTADEWGQFDTVILDEGHRAVGVLPDTRQRNKVSIPKTSKTFEAIFTYLQTYPPKRFYIATATPVSKPMNAWAIAKLQGKNPDFFKFREAFYFPTMMGRRQVWLPRKDEASRQRLALYVQKLGYTGSLADFMDVPEQTHEEVEISLSDEQKVALRELNENEADAFIRRSYMRTIENGILYTRKVEDLNEIEQRLIRDTKYFKNGKIDYIVDRAEEFPKLMVFAAYTAQVDAISAALMDAGYYVRTVTGFTHPTVRATVFEDFDKQEKGVLVVQAAICEGYRVPSVPCAIFASKSNRFLHYDQGKGRILDSQHLKKNLFIHLVVPDGADESCHKTVMSGEDFQEKLSAL